MSEEQQLQYINFVANFVDHIQKAGLDRQNAVVAASLASSVLLATVMRVDPEQDEALDAFAVRWLQAALHRSYDRKEMHA